MTIERIILSFPLGGTRFNYRVAGAAIRDGHVLVCREDDDDYCMLPGGRVEMGEPSDIALVREMAEELVMPVALGPLLFTSESFYGREGDRYHELGFIYGIELPEHVRPGGTQPFLVREDEGASPAIFLAAARGIGANFGAALAPMAAGAVAFAHECAPACDFSRRGCRTVRSPAQTLSEPCPA